MNRKNIIIPIADAAVVLVIGIAIYINNKPDAVPLPDDSLLPPVQVVGYTATDYPQDMPQQAVSGILESLSFYVEHILATDFDIADFLNYAYDSQILRLNITESSGQIVLITEENASSFAGNQNPLHSTKQLVFYAANSGHTINDLSLADEVATVGAKDFFTSLSSAVHVAGADGAPDQYELSEQTRIEIIQYCSEMLADNRDTELFILSDDVVAFVVCERYSEDSLLGSFSFLEKTSNGAYLLRTMIDFNC